MRFEVPDQLLSIAKEAGAVVLSHYGAALMVDFKGPSNPVTAADREANTLICERLAQRFPGVPVVAEESAPETFTGHAMAEAVFFVDPLDGTKEFIAHTGEFVIMLGMIEGGRARHGVVYSPVTGSAWLGSVGTGACGVARDGARQALRPSNQRSLAGATLVAARSRKRGRVASVLESWGVARVLSVGSAGLKGAHVASGLADLYLSPGSAGMRWDACAIDALVRAAGGEFTNAHGQAIDYRSTDLNNRKGLLASNGHLHAAVLEQLQTLRNERPSPRASEPPAGRMS